MEFLTGKWADLLAAVGHEAMAATADDLRGDEAFRSIAGRVRSFHNLALLFKELNLKLPSLSCGSGYRIEPSLSIKHYGMTAGLTGFYTQTKTQYPWNLFILSIAKLFPVLAIVQ